MHSLLEERVVVWELSALALSGRTPREMVLGLKGRGQMCIFVPLHVLSFIVNKSTIGQKAFLLSVAPPRHNTKLFGHPQKRVSSPCTKFDVNAARIP